MFQVMEDILVLWNIGPAEIPSSVWWKVQVFEIEQPEKADGIISAL